MWREDGCTDAATFDEIAARLLRCWDALHALVRAQFSSTGR
jgi:hypothetical protein